MEKMQEKKRLRINIVRNVKEAVDPFDPMSRHDFGAEFQPCLIGEKEYPNIYLDHDITDEEFESALDILVTHMMQHQLHSINLDLDIRDKILEDRNKPMEITLKELKHFFGRDVVIVQRKEEENGEQQSTN